MRGSSLEFYKMRYTFFTETCFNCGEEISLSFWGKDFCYFNVTPTGLNHCCTNCALNKEHAQTLFNVYKLMRKPEPPKPMKIRSRRCRRRISRRK